MNIEQILEKMTIEEKIALCSGADFWHTKDMEQYGIPSIMMCDGPHGLRKQINASDMLGLNESLPATSFPTAVLSACSWDVELLKKMGEAIAREAIANDVNVILGPGANIKRNPLCGRNFEYFSEDPYLTGKLAAAHISGIEKTGTGSSLKHFALNNQEYKRFSSDSLVDDRTMREIYLTGFETAVKEGKPSTVMSAYNKINGTYCSDNHWLLTELLREEWGFDGLVVTDWGGMSNRIDAFKAGCDLMMPGGAAYMEKESLEAVKKGELSEESVNASARRVLELIAKTMHENAEAVDMQSHFELARQIAEESAVLLKNEDGILPLENEADVVFIGHMAKEIRYQGSGSSHINPWKLVNVTDVCQNVKFCEGCLADGSTTEVLLKEAEEVAKHTEKVVVFAGLTDIYESEGFDRENMKMPEGHVQLIERVAVVNPNVIVVLMCGSAVETPWIDKVKAILYMGLPGEAGGEAIANVLFGKQNPCGKLAETWPLTYDDCVCKDYYGEPYKNAQYREGIYVGYRYYETAGVKVRFPFGYGLSYTNFAYSDLKVEGNRVSCIVTNMGDISGKEIVQLYIEPINSNVHRPVRELKGFAKVELQPGESKKVSFLLNDRSFAIWKDGWKVPEGDYNICIGKNCHEMCLIEEIHKAGEAVTDSDYLPNWYRTLKGTPTQEGLETLLGRIIIEKPLKKGEFTKENTVVEMKEHSLIMKIVYFIVEMVMARRYGGKDYSNPTFKMMMQMSMDCSFSGMRINSGMNNYLLEGLLEIANGRFLKGIRLMMKKSVGMFVVILCFLLVGCNEMENPKTNTVNSIDNAESLDESKEFILPNDFFNNEGIGENAFANLCLSSFYDSPKDVDLEELFYNGFGLEINESDRRFLEKQNAEMDYDVIKLPKSEMDKIMIKYFGISLSESNWVGIEKFYYNKETDIYYLVHSDYHQWQVNILEQFIDEMGNINVVYSKVDDEQKCIAIIKKEDENYRFLSNQLYDSK